MTRGLRVLLADEDRERLSDLGRLVNELGHEVLAIADGAEEAARAVAAEDPDLTMVRLHESDDHALALIAEVSEYASGPILVLIDDEDPEFVARAAEKGISAYVRPVNGEALQSSIEVATRRHGETEALQEKVGQLETALERRAFIERAKGILMERHGIEDRAAFELLRDNARRTNRKVVDLARAVTDGHSLLPK